MEIAEVGEIKQTKIPLQNLGFSTWHFGISLDFIVVKMC